MLKLSYKNLIFFALATVGLTTNLANAKTKFNNIQVAEIKQDNSSYIGLSYGKINLPQGLKNIGGWIVGDPYASKVYSISHLAKGTEQMLWFEILTTDKYGKSDAQVIDIVNLPKLSKLEAINGFCLFKGVKDPEITAIVKYQNTEYFRNIKKAWRANRKSGKFEQISPRNIACQNPGWGV